MIYAPVAIPTLNRYEHVKNCLESLNNCIWADRTDVYVALDYPPSEKYIEGYEKVKKYLETATFCFKSFSVIKRDRNYGFGPSGNSSTLLNEEIWPKYDRVIVSEDDNVFAQTFLQFMDYGLDVCSRRDDILTVGGFAIPADWVNDGKDIVLLNSNANTWGYGILRNRFFEIQDIDVQQYYHSILSSKERTNKILSGSHNDCGAMAWYIMNGNKGRNDTFKSIYARDKGLYCLFPKYSKVFNAGTDGSGQNSGKSDPYGIASVKLDPDTNLRPEIFEDIPPFYEETINAINSFYHIPGWKMAWIKFVFKTHNFWRKNTNLGKLLRKTYIKLNPRL